MTETEKMLMLSLAATVAIILTHAALSNREIRNLKEEVRWNSEQLIEKKASVYQTNSALWLTNLNQK